MATYAIGDVQGCHGTLLELLRAIEFDPDRDRLWFAGDLVNRGPRSLDVLRWARDHDDCIVSILGNHDVHLLARAIGGAPLRPKDTFGDVLAAPDRDELITWLRHRPLVHEEGDFLMLHAGVLPVWDRARLLELAHEAERALRGREHRELITSLAEKQSVHWTDTLDQDARIRSTIRILCNLRTCTPDGQPAFDFAGPPSEAPDDRIPWHRFPGRRPLGATVVCGHWAAQGLVVRDDMIALDTAAVWGNSLTAIDLDTLETTAVPLSDEVDV